MVLHEPDVIHGPIYKEHSKLDVLVEVLIIYTGATVLSTDIGSPNSATPTASISRVRFIKCVTKTLR